MADFMAKGLQVHFELQDLSEIYESKVTAHAAEVLHWKAVAEDLCSRLEEQKAITAELAYHNKRLRKQSAFVVNQLRWLPGNEQTKQAASMIAGYTEKMMGNLARRWEDF